MIYVKNKRTYKGDGVYIGRPSVFGNPFPLYREESRPAVIESYRNAFNRWLGTREEQSCERLRNELLALIQIARHGDLYLICWCAPLPCHGDVIKEFIEDFLEGKKNIYGERLA